ncbi:MAG: hypothetical protein EBT04_16400 [Betaproteobacteria bacterium]|nr:hypothetical protein [Betaproteobacteria bacterium]
MGQAQDIQEALLDLVWRQRPGCPRCRSANAACNPGRKRSEPRGLSECKAFHSGR